MQHNETDALGILALWKDCAPGAEPTLERWFQSEHLEERVSLPGFRRGRRYEAVDAGQSNFTYYETDNPAVLVSPAYLRRLDNPTPLTQKVMSRIMHNMTRTICRLDHRIGACRGAFAVTVQLTAPATADDLAGLAPLAADPGFARLELWNAAELTTHVSAEEKARGGDRSIAACLLIEALRETAARDFATAAKTALRGSIAEVGIYRLLCELEKRDLQAAAQ